MNRLSDLSPANGPPPRGEHIPRGWLHLAALAGLTLVGVYFCYRLAEPFLPALAWAVALAIIAYPLHAWITRRIPSSNWSAAISTTLVVAAIVVPSVLVALQLAGEATMVANAKQAAEGGWREAVAQAPVLNEALARVEQHVNVEQEARRLIASLSAGLGDLAKDTVWAALQGLVMVFILFFAFRDHDHLLRAIRSLLPVTRSEADYLFTRTSDAVHANVYATIVTGLLQGVTGGLLFWALGVPAPLLWGAVMFVLSVIPIVGAFIVWVPVAVGLALEQRWGSAAAIVAWGVLMAGPICNFVYAHVAGDRQRLHPVPSLLAFIGGLALFGVTGMVLGPVLLAVTLALIDMWRRRAEPTSESPAETATALPRTVPQSP